MLAQVVEICFSGIEQNVLVTHGNIEGAMTNNNPNLARVSRNF
jgi:hypothetical protein